MKKFVIGIGSDISDVVAELAGYNIPFSYEGNDIIMVKDDYEDEAEQILDDAYTDYEITK